jgi:hypothetical protein
MAKINRLEENLRLKDLIPIFGINNYANRCYFAKKERNTNLTTSFLFEDKKFDYDEAIRGVKTSVNNALLLSIYNGLLFTSLAYLLLK